MINYYSTVCSYNDDHCRLPQGQTGLAPATFLTDQPPPAAGATGQIKVPITIQHLLCSNNKVKFSFLFTEKDIPNKAGIKH